MSHEEKVYTKLKQHYHCAQAIFATYASDYGMDQETAYRTMACFAAGMYTGSVCGCVTAALANTASAAVTQPHTLPVYIPAAKHAIVRYAVS